MCYNVFYATLNFFRIYEALQITIMIIISSSTYVSERWNTTSWLDHVMASIDFHSSLNKINIMYDVSDEDHIAFKVYINIDNIKNLTSSINNGRAKIRWNNITDNDISK